MWSTAILLLPFALQTPTPRAIEGISNGNFEYMWVPDDPTDPVVDGAFWVGGETRTAFGAGNRFLRFPAAHAGERVYQRVSCAHGKESSLTLNATARIAASGDVALVTFIEGLTPGDGTLANGTTNMHAMGTVLAKCPPYTGWTFTEQIGTSSTPIDPCMTSTSGNVLNSFTSLLARGSMTAEWSVHHDGNVRIVMRARSEGVSGTPSPVLHEWFLDDPSTGPALLTSFTVDEDDQGQTYIARTPVVVGQTVRLKVTLQGTSPSSFEWRPQIAYEGRRLTYRFTDFAATPVDTSLQKWIPVSATVGTWTQIPTSVQDVGAEFNARFGAYPDAPVEIELASALANTNRVDFDDVSLTREFDLLSAAELRDKAVAEGAWVRDQYKAVRDSGAGQLGPIATPYMVGLHQLRTENAPIYFTGTPTGDAVGSEPFTLRTLLDEHFGDAADYDDFFTIKENERQHVNATTGMLYTAYDVYTDQWLTGPTQNTSADAMGDMAGLWYQTNDVSCLDVAYAYGNIVYQNGVYANPNDVNDPHNGLVLSGPYRISDGFNPDVNDPDYFDDQLPPATSEEIGKPLGHLAGTVPLIAAYVACKNYNLAHPTPPLRYDPVQLALWIKVIRASARAFADMKIYQPLSDASHPAHWGDWTTTDWKDLSGYFSDMYGYMGNSATAALDILAKLPTPLTTDEAAAQTALRDDFVLDGAEHFIGQWEQAVFRSEQAAGDNARTWSIFAWLVPYLESINLQTTADRYKAQIARAAEHAARFQYRGGYWVACGQDEYQQLAGDTGGVRLYAPPGPYPYGMSLALHFAPTVSTQRDWLAILNTLFDVTKAKYARPHGYQSSVLIPPGQDEKAGGERFLVENYLFLLANIPPSLLNLPVKPTASITPPSLSSPGASGQTFQFVFHVPTATTTADLQTALNTRVRVLRWHNSAGPGTWRFNVMWPDQPTYFATPVLDPVAKTITLTTAALVPPTSEPLKFDAHIWDADGQWQRDTSYQPVW